MCLSGLLLANPTCSTSASTSQVGPPANHNRCQLAMWTVPGKSASVCALGSGPHKTRTPTVSSDYSLGLN